MHVMFIQVILSFLCCFKFVKTHLLFIFLFCFVLFCSIFAIGHAEFVVGVQFMANDSQVASTGGADMSVFQWKVC